MATYEEPEIVGVFSSLEKAKEYLNEGMLDKLKAENPNAVLVAGDCRWLHDGKWDSYEINAIEVDSLSPIKWRLFTNAEFPQLQFIGSAEAEEQARRYSPRSDATAEANTNIGKYVVE